MKVLYLLTLAFGLATAVDVSVRDSQLHTPHKQTTRPKKFTGPFTMRAANKPAGAPADYKTGIGSASRSMSKDGLTKLPSDLVTKRRRDSLAAMRILQRQSTANDFYTCTADPTAAPRDSDCNVIIDNVFNSGDTLVLDKNACLTFTYGRCEGFFCSLCQTLQTTTDFIGNQLDTAEQLCVSNGQDGTIIGEDAPQWDAGFTYPGNSLPTFNVC